MLDFPNAPTVGQKYPASPVGGVPTYVWDGEKWTTNGGALGTGLPPSNTVPRMDGAGASGVSINYSRGDHQHPTDTSRAAAVAPAFTGGITTDTLTVTGTASFGGAITAVSMTLSGTATIGVVKANTLNVGNSPLNYPLSVRVAADKNFILFNDGGAAVGLGAVNDAGSANVPMNIWTSGLSLSGPVSFQTYPTAPTPPAADNSTKVATTAFVLANMPVVGGFLPLSGGTLTGQLVVNADITSSAGSITTRGWSGNQATGLILFGNTGARYCYWDGTTYNFNGGAVTASNGRLWGAFDFGTPVSNGRLAMAADFAMPGAGGMNEPYGGAVVTGMYATSGWVFRFRYMQLYTTGWFTCGYA